MKAKGNTWRRLLRAAVFLYGVSLLAAALPLFGSDVCTQYDIDWWWLPLTPVLSAFGAFVIFALAVSAFRDGSGFALLVVVLVLAALGAVPLLIHAALRGDRAALWFGLLLALAGVVSLLGTFFFCVSLSA